MKTETSTGVSTRTRKTKSKPDVKVAGLLSVLPDLSRAPTAEEADALLASWNKNLADDPAAKRRVELDGAELINALGPKLGENQMMIAFAAKKTIDMLAAAMSMNPVDCMVEVTGTMVIGISAGIRLGLMMERNDKLVADSLNDLGTLSSAPKEAV